MDVLRDPNITLGIERIHHYAGKIRRRSTELDFNGNPAVVPRSARGQTHGHVRSPLPLSVVIASAISTGQWGKRILRGLSSDDLHRAVPRKLSLVIFKCG